MTFFLAKLFHFLAKLAKPHQFDPCYTWWKNVINKCSSYENEVIAVKSLLFIATNSILKCKGNNRHYYHPAKRIRNTSLQNERSNTAETRLFLLPKYQQLIIASDLEIYNFWIFPLFKFCFNVVVIWCFPRLLPVAAT